MKNSFLFRIRSSTIVLLCLLEATAVTAQGRWEALGSPAGSAIDKMISTTDKKLFIFMQYSGIQYSDDLGQNWTIKNDGLESSASISLLAAGPDGSVFLTIEDKIYRLKSVQSDWEYLGNLGAKIDAIYLSDNGKLFFILGNTIYASDDGGSNFELFFESPSQFGTISGFSFNGNNNNYLCSYKSSNCWLFNFNDDASQVTQIVSVNLNLKNLSWHSDGNLFLNNYNDIYRWNEFDKKLSKVQISPSNSKTLVGQIIKDPYNQLINLSDTSYLSIDGGTNWQVLKNQVWAKNNSYPKRNFTFIDSSLFISEYLCGSASLIRYINIDSTYQNLSDKLINQSVFQIDIDTLQRMFIKTCFNLVATYTKSLLSIDNGQSWTKMNINGDEVINIQSNKANIYHAVCHDSSYYSVDYGKTWNPLKYEISSYKNFYFAPDQTLYMVGLGGPYLTRSKVDGSDLEIIEPGICCDGDILQLLFHPTGRIYINWSGNLFYSDARGENAQYDRQNSMRCYPGCILSSKGDLYSLENGLNFIEPDLSQKTLIEPLDFRARIAGIDNNNQVFVFDPVKGLLLCNRSACKPFDMTGLPFPYMFIRTIYQDENNFLYVGLDNDKIYKYSQPIVSNKLFTNERYKPCMAR